MPPAQAPAERRRFPFFAGYALWFMPALWRDAGRRWGGIGFFYMLILLALCWAAVAAKNFPAVKRVVREEIPKFVKEIPAIDIKDGKVTTDVPYEPYYIMDPENERPIAVIDTTGETTEPPENEPSMLLTSNKLYMRNNGKVEIHDLSPVKSFHLDSARMQGWADKVVELWWPAIVPVWVVLMMLLRLVLMLLYGCIGLAVASGVRPRLGFGGCMRLAALALTPVILVDTIFMLTGVSGGCAWTIGGIALAIGLLVVMVRANNEPTLQPPSPYGGGYPPGGFPMGMQQQQQGYAPPGYVPPMQQQPYNVPPPPPPPTPPRPPGF
jgi:hypothetical protein